MNIVRRIISKAISAFLDVLKGELEAIKEKFK